MVVVYQLRNTFVERKSGIVIHWAMYLQQQRMRAYFAKWQGRKEEKEEEEGWLIFYHESQLWGTRREAKG